jgi:hypothetical protein
MNLFTQIIVGLGIAAVGFSMSAKTEWVLRWMGRNWWAEKTFGPGGSRTFYKLVGLGVSILGIIIATDLFDRIVGGFITSVFGG